VRLIQLEVSNFCQHESKVIVFGDGLNAIVGANGSGKSNILNAVGFALTGEIDTAGVKADNINQRAGKNAKSFVELVFEHGGSTVVIRRNLRPKTPTAIMTINGREEISGDAAVKAAVESMLGVSQEILRAMVVVTHSELFSFLDQSPAARRSQFQKLFRLERAETALQELTGFISRMEVPVMSEDSAAVTVKLTNCRLELRRCQEAIAANPNTAASVQAELQLCERVLREIELSKRLDTHVTLYTEQEAVATAPAAEAALAVKLLEAVIISKEMAIAGVDEAYVDVQAKAWLLYDQVEAVRVASSKYVAQLEAACVVATEAEQVLRDTASPEQLLSDEQVRQDEGRRNELATDIAVLSQLANMPAFDKCPTCGAVGTHVLERKQQAVKDLEPKLTERLTISRRLDSAAAYKASLTKAVTYSESCRNQLQAASQTMVAPPVPPPSDRRDVVYAVTQLQQLWQALRELQSTLTGRQSEVLRATTTLTEATTRKQAAIDSRSAFVVDYSKEPEISADLATWQLVVAAIQQANTTETVLADRVLQLESQLTATLAAEEEARAVRDVRGIFVETQRILHSQSAPAIVVQSNLQRLRGAINQQLELFDADFRIDVADEASFTASFVDGTVQPAQRLSQGQKVAMAFAFRLAMTRTIIPQVNCLLLDEPTAFLDSRRIEAFEPVFTHLKRMSESSGLQCVVVTHERRLDHLFSKVIELT